MRTPIVTADTGRTRTVPRRRARRGHVRLAAMIAATALVLVGCGGGDDGDDDAAGGTDSAASGSVEVEAGDLYFEPEQLTATAGEVEITLNNVGAVEHDFVVEEAGDTEVVHTAAGESATGTIELEAGTYTYYCSIPGHRASMEGTLEVS